MADQVTNMKMITEMNNTPLHQHALTLLLKESRGANETTLYLTQAAELIPQLLEMDKNRPSHQKLMRLLEDIPALHPALQTSTIMGVHPSSTMNDIEEMTEEMLGIRSLDELALLIADNLLGVLNR